MNEIAEKWIRTCAKKRNIDFSKHALERMAERSIEDWQVMECIIYGKVIEYQDLGKEFDIHVLFQEATKNKPDFYTVVAASYPYPMVISVCKTKDEVWESHNNILRRRKLKND